MKLITIVTNEDHAVFRNMLKPSVERAGLELVVAKVSTYADHHTKDTLLLSIIKKLDRKEVVLFSDAYDAVILGTRQEINRKYRLKNRSVVFSAEPLCWPTRAIASKFPLTVSPFRFLNSGGFVGEAGTICDIINDTLSTEHTRMFPWSNQIYWQEQFLRKQDLIGLDTECDLFGVLGIPEDLELVKDLRSTRPEDIKKKRHELFDKSFFFHDGRLHVRATNGYPCHIHFNGPLTSILADIVKEGIVPVKSHQSV
ncbi:MAG TPA: hypothetical protein VFE50_01075 [Cyclobacteriaceae bacterium]|nr:hypothetical protein [Cyclobacteriaceae bacterium]